MDLSAQHYLFWKQYMVAASPKSTSIVSPYTGRITLADSMESRSNLPIDKFGNDRCFATLPLEKSILVAVGRSYYSHRLDARPFGLSYTATHGLEFSPEELTSIGCNRRILEEIGNASMSYLSENLERLIAERGKDTWENEKNYYSSLGRELDRSVPSPSALSSMPPITIPPIQVILSSGAYVPDRGEYEGLRESFVESVATLLAGKDARLYGMTKEAKECLAYGILSMVTPWKFMVNTADDIVGIKYGTLKHPTVHVVSTLYPRAEETLPDEARRYATKVVEAFLSKGSTEAQGLFSAFYETMERKRPNRNQPPLRRQHPKGL